MNPQYPLHGISTVGNFTGNELFGNNRRKTQIIGPAILLTSQQDIAGHRTLDLFEKSALFRKKAQRNIPLGTESHKERTAADITKTDEPIQGMDRQTERNFAIHPYRNGLPVLCQIGALGCDKKCIKMFFHSTSIWLR
jgi:hypothetical protein